MKKSLVALAVLGAFAGVASAQSSVTVYGIVDAGVVRESGAAAGSVTKLTSGVQSGSRLGFKGTEDLGGGLSANFVLETGLALDTGGFNQGNTAFGRAAWVGLKGGFGNVKLGRQFSPFYDVLTEVVDPFETGLTGAATNLLGDKGIASGATVGTTAINNTTRLNNSIKYVTPEFSGFSAQLAYGFGEVIGNSSGNRVWGTSLGYKNGPLNVGLGYNNQNNAAATTSLKSWLLGANYDFNVVKAYLAYGQNKGAVYTGSAVESDTRDWLLGLTAPVGPGKIFTSYIRRDDRSVLNNDANQWALGYTYDLSKRTNLYTSYGRISNNNTAAYTVGSAIDAGSGDKAFAVGVRHKF